MGHHNVLVARVTARGHKGAAVAGTHQVRGIRHFMFRVIPGNIIVGNFLEGVQGDDVVQIQGHALGLQSVGDALQFLLIFRSILGQSISRAAWRKKPQSRCVSCVSRSLTV